MLDAALKGVRFGAGERRRWLWNTHLTWVTYWLLANDALRQAEFWGLNYYFFDTPDPLLFAMAGLAAVSNVLVGRDLFARWRATGALPLNGLVAYVAAVHVWLAVSLVDPVLLLVVPAFHSLQYLVVVWRYQLNVQGGQGASAAAPARGVRSEGPEVGGPGPGLERIESRASIIRGLYAVVEPTRLLVTRSELGEIVAGRVEEQRDDLDGLGALYEALGVVEPGADMVDLLSGLLGEVVNGMFDTETGELYVAAGDPSTRLRA